MATRYGKWSGYLPNGERVVTGRKHWAAPDDNLPVQVGEEITLVSKKGAAVVVTVRTTAQGKWGPMFTFDYVAPSQQKQAIPESVDPFEDTRTVEQAATQAAQPIINAMAPPITAGSDADAKLKQAGALLQSLLGGFDEAKVREVVNATVQQAVQGALQQAKDESRTISDQSRALVNAIQTADANIRKAEETALQIVADMDRIAADALARAAMQVAKANAPLILQVGTKTPVALKDHTHPLFAKIAALVAIGGVNILLIGPAGCGKTHMAHQLASVFERKYGTVHCTAGMSESAVAGWLLPIGDNGRFSYTPSEFVTLYGEGNSIFLIDEIDAADPNVLMFLNGALANGALHIPHRLDNPVVQRGPNQTIIAAANTFGTGANRLHSARSALDAATLDRFYPVVMDYDKALEANLLGLPVPANEAWVPSDAPTERELQELGQWVIALRETVKQNPGIQRIVSTRTIQKALLARKAGLSSREIKTDILAGWSKDELAKVRGL
jgi:MoxR-like ATPase